MLDKEARISKTSEWIRFNPELLKSMSVRFYELNVEEIYREIVKEIGLDRNDYERRDFLTLLTRELMVHWSNNKLFLLWAELREHEWNGTLYGILRREAEFKGVEERYQRDPRRPFVR